MLYKKVIRGYLFEKRYFKKVKTCYESYPDSLIYSRIELCLSWLELKIVVVKSLPKCIKRLF